MTNPNDLLNKIDVLSGKIQNLNEEEQIELKAITMEINSGDYAHLNNNQIKQEYK